MRKFVIAFATAFLISFVFSPSVFAQENTPPKNVTLNRGEVIDGDYFPRGEVVVISGVVNGDVYAFGEKIVIDGEVNGDVIAAGGTVEVRGRVSEDARVGGGQIIVTGEIGGSLTAGGGQVNVDNDARIGESVVIGAGSVRIDGPVSRGATIGAGDLTLNSEIGSSVRAGVGNLTLSNDAKINGDLNYWSENDANIGQDAEITGKATKHITTHDRDRTARGIAAGIGGFWIALTIASLISAFIVGLLLLKFVPVFMQDVFKNYMQKPWQSMGIGILTIILSPILFVVLLITLIGIPLAIILLFALIITWMFVKVFVAIYIGTWIQKKLKLRRSEIWALAIGLIAWVVATNIPLVGGILTFVATVATFGAVLMAKKNLYLRLSSKKLI